MDPKATRRRKHGNGVQTVVIAMTVGDEKVGDRCWVDPEPIQSRQRGGTAVDEDAPREKGRGEPTPLARSVVRPGGGGRPVGGTSAKEENVHGEDGGGIQEMGVRSQDSEVGIQESGFSFQEGGWDGLDAFLLEEDEKGEVASNQDGDDKPRGNTESAVQGHLPETSPGQHGCL